MTKRYDTARTPHQRAAAHDTLDREITSALAEQYAQLNPARLRRDILAYSDQLVELNPRQTPCHPRRGSTQAGILI